MSDDGMLGAEDLRGCEDEPHTCSREQDTEALLFDQLSYQSKLDALSAEFRIERDEFEATNRDLRVRLVHSNDELARLRALINTPQTDDFFAAVRVEAAHQVERWGTAHDAGKTAADWYWLIGYLAGKALQADKDELPRYRHVKRGTTYEVLSVAEDENHRGTQCVVYRGEDDGKIWSRPSDQFFDGRFERLPATPGRQLHHVVTTAAALLNWHRSLTGESTAMRPGIDPLRSAP